MSVTTKDPAVTKLEQGMDMDTLDVFESLYTKGWELKSLSGGRFQWQHAGGEKSEVLSNDGAAVAFAREKAGVGVSQTDSSSFTSAGDVARELIDSPGAEGGQTQGRVIERLLSQEPTPHFSAHELDLRDDVREELDERGISATADVPTSAGTIDLYSEEDVLYEFKCSLTAVNFKETVERALTLRAAMVSDTVINDSAPVVIVACCIDDADVDNMDKLRAAAQELGIEVDTWDYNVNSDTLKIVNPRFKSSTTLFPSEELSATVLMQQMHPSKLTTHTSLLMRAHGLDEDYVDELAAGYAVNRSYPPVDVFFDGETYWLADGNHRHAGASRAGVPLDITLHKGTLRDAILFALQANAEHGLKLTNDDKRLKAVTLLSDPEWFKKSDTQLAVIAGGITQPFISSVRRDLTQILPTFEPGDIEEQPLDVQLDSTAHGRLIKILHRLPAEQLAALTQNVLGDDGRRRGKDNVVRSVAKPAAEEPSLFVETAGTNPETAAEAEQAPSTDTVEPATEELASSPARTTSELLATLKAQPDGIYTDELLRGGFTLDQVQEAQRAFLIERHTNGKCYYAWKPKDIIAEIETHGPVSLLALEGMGCQRYAISAAEADGLIKRRASDSAYVLAERNEAPTVSSDTTATVTSGEPASEEETPAPVENMPFTARMPAELARTGWELETDSGRVRGINQPLKLQTAWMDLEGAVNAARKLQEKHDKRPDELLKGRDLTISYNFTKEMPGEVTVGVSLDDSGVPVLIEVWQLASIRPFPEPVLDMISAQVKAARQTAAAQAPTATRAATRKASTKKATTKKALLEKKAATRATTKKSSAKKQESPLWRSSK
jgi:hypothetical protein